MDIRIVATGSLLAAGLIALFLGVGSVIQNEQPPDNRKMNFSAIPNVARGNFERIALPWDFQFPRDHGRHSQIRTEWWQLAGNLKDKEDRPIGVQFAVVRISLDSKPNDHPSRWAASEIYGSYFAINRPDNGMLYTDQRWTRGGDLGLAGWEADPMRLWVEDWRVEQIGSQGNTLDWRALVRSDNLRLELELRNQQSLIDTNDFTDATSNPGLPFVLYLQPRLGGSGSLIIDNQEFGVRGSLSVEHAWGELPLPGGAVARDRFAMYIDDGRAIFLIRSHQGDGSIVPTVAGLLIESAGKPVSLTDDDIELEPIGFQESGIVEARYPINWTLRIPDQAIDLELRSQLENGEGELWTPLWMGPVRLQDKNGTARGEGLVQLMGYDGT